jgi:hypothetical protein
MTVGPCNWPALQHVSCAAANASTGEFHIVDISGTLERRN